MSCKKRSILTCQCYPETGRPNCITALIMFLQGLNISEHIMCTTPIAFSSRHWRQKLSIQDARILQIIFKARSIQAYLAMIPVINKGRMAAINRPSWSLEESAQEISGTHCFWFWREVIKLDASAVLSFPLISTSLATLVWHLPNHF